MKASEARRSAPDALDDDGGHVERGDVVYGLDEAGAQRRRARTVQRLQRHRVEHLRTTPPHTPRYIALRSLVHLRRHTSITLKP